MITNRQLKLELVKEQNNYVQIVRSVLSGILMIDPSATVHPTEKAIASRSLVKKLWEMLPGEEQSYQFSDIAEQTKEGVAFLRSYAFSQPVTLHLGWDLLCFSCTLKAAWESWNYFSELNNDTYNACIYPADIGWYVVRAGN